jgi:formylglycine-generating enzyme required for sulfatase activity
VALLEVVKPPSAPVAGAITVPDSIVVAAADVRDKEALRPGEIKVTSAPERSPYPQPGQPWENMLGMRFAPVPGAGVLFAVWDTRVQDFEAFVKESGYDATGGMYSLGSDGWKLRGNTWRSPGFPQGGLHPVCGVSWSDAKAFCSWLTEKERREGRLGPDQEYRLPSDAEWSVAAGLDEPRAGTPQSKSLGIKNIYPWGPQWPPPHGGGNYAGSEARDRTWPADWSVIDAYGDGYPRTSPVGSFTANRFGLYDMGGNVWQWCEDFYNGSSGSRVLRGGSFASNLAGDLLASNRNISDPDKRYDFDGFRCVLAVVQDGHDH